MWKNFMTKYYINQKTFNPLDGNGILFITPYIKFKLPNGTKIFVKVFAFIVYLKKFFLFQIIFFVSSCNIYPFNNVNNILTSLSKG